MSGAAHSPPAPITAAQVAQDAVLVHALSEPARQFQLSRGFVPSPLQGMTLIMTLATLRSLLAEPEK